MIQPRTQSRWYLPVQVIGYPLAVWLVWFWFGIAERNAGDLLLSGIVGISIVALLSGLLWLAFRGPMWRSVAFVIVVLGLACIGPAVVPRTANVWAVRAGVLTIAALLIPFLLLGRAALLRTPHYWSRFLLLALGVWLVPSLLIGFVPKLPSLAAQTASMIARFTLAYAVALLSFIAFAGHVRLPEADPSAATKEP